MGRGLSFLMMLVLPIAAGAGDIAPLSASVQDAMRGKAWSAECPVPLEELRAVSVDYVDFDGAARQGVLVIHQRFAEDVRALFDELYAIRFPIRTIQPYESFEVGKSAYSDATLGFYCRRAQDAPGEWSGHAYGAAIDINPLENPFLDPADGWWPDSAAPMAPREPGKGKVYEGSDAYLIFIRHGWSWGGFYKGEPDYMHFYKPVRK